MRDDEKAALKIQMREIEDFIAGRLADGDVRSDSDENLLVDVVMRDVIRKLQGLSSQRHGRPDVFHSSNPVTHDSYHTFRFVQRELQFFRKRIGRVRVPKDARDCFMKYAKLLYPEANEVTVGEYMREIKKAPIEDQFQTANWRSINLETARD